MCTQIVSVYCTFGNGRLSLWFVFNFGKDRYLRCVYFSIFVNV